MRHYAGACVAASALLCCAAALHYDGGQDRLLIVVSIDAMRYSFLERDEASFIQRLGNAADPLNAGVGAHHGRLRPQFPSYTMTNHYTLVSGQRPARHGIVGNAFYDARLGETFRVGVHDQSESDKRWWRAEPIYITAARSGLRTASMCWPGNAVWRHRLHRHVPFDKDQSDMHRVAAALAWLDEDPGLRMLHLYFARVDVAGHEDGPDSFAMASALRSVDAALAALVRGLRALGRWDATDFVVVSDHGMAPLEPGCVVDIHAAVPGLAQHVQWLDHQRPVTPVHPVPGSEALVHDMLQRAIKTQRLPLEVHWTHSLPQRLHFRPGPRTGVLVLAADAGCTMSPAATAAPGVPLPEPHRGAHGYDAAAVPDMDGVIVVRGPSFARSRGNRLRGAEVAWDNVDFYALQCRLLGVGCLEHDGSNALADQVLLVSDGDDL